MSKLKVEKIGGFGGFGVGNSHLKSRGEIDMDQLSEEDKKAIEDLFISEGKSGGSHGNTFLYRISRISSKGIESIEADEERVPNTVAQCVKDEII